MRRSIEFSSKRSLEASNSIEKTSEYTYKPFDRESALDMARKMRELLDSLPEDEENISKETAIKEAKEKVLASFRKAENPTKIHDIDQPKNIEGHEFRFTSNQKTSEKSDEPTIEEESVTTKVEPNETPAEETEERVKDITAPEIEKQPNAISEDVSRALFGESANIKNILGDQQFSEWQNIVNQDLNNGKYTNARLENGIVYHIGNVNENNVDNRGDDWDIMKYRSRDERLKYNDQVKSIDPEVWKQLGKTVYALGATLGDNSKEYHDALNKINQDIYDGRYQTAKYTVTRNKSEDSEEGVITFNETLKNESMQEGPINEPENVILQEEPINEKTINEYLQEEQIDEPKTNEPEKEDALNTQAEEQHEPTMIPAEEPEPATPSTKESFQGEMTNIIRFEGRKCVDTLKKIYAQLNKADTEQKDRFRYLYENLSAISKIEPSNKDEEQRQLDQIYAYKNLINKLYDELGGEQ